MDEKIFLFVDESQLDEYWASYAKLIFDRTFNVFMIFTGSSALKLNINTDATRRITTENIFPLTFKEYLFLKHNVDCSSNNFKDLILKGDADSYNAAVDYEKSLKNKLVKLNNDFNIEFKRYLYYKSFPFTLDFNEDSSYPLINNIVDKIINDDLSYFRTFNNIDNNLISRLVTFLATKKPGDTFDVKIARSLGISSKSVNNILFALEKAELIFSINAYGPAGKILKKSQQHFFLSPSIKTAINYRVGRYNLNNDKCFAVLAENLVASIIHNLAQKPMSSLSLFYDADKKGVDFLVRHVDRIIPIEVGIGKKTKRQVTLAKKKFNSDFGILVSNRTSEIEFHDDIFYIPLSTFALI